MSLKVKVFLCVENINDMGITINLALINEKCMKWQ